MATQKYQFTHVDYLWDPEVAASYGQDQVQLLIYRSNLLGRDLRLTNFGGGNTSCKTKEKDPLTGQPEEIMWIKGSGGDLGTLTRKGLSALYTGRLRSLTGVYRGLAFEDEMVGLFNHCLYDTGSVAPSIDTPLHGFLPYRHIDHLHPDAVIAIAASRDGRDICRQIFGETMGWIGWKRPGFDLGLELRKCVEENPGIRGVILASHGLFTWGDTAHESYVNTLEVIDKCTDYIEAGIKRAGKVFGGLTSAVPGAEDRSAMAARIAPLLRGLCSSENRMVGHFRSDEKVMEFVNSADMSRLAAMGTSCPDHFLRTKISPLIIDRSVLATGIDEEQMKAKLQTAFEEYREMYRNYYAECRQPDSPPIRDPNPVVIIIPDTGIFTFAKDKQTARVASEFYVNAINVMRGAETISQYVSLSRQEAFNIEYWLLEEAKLQRMPKPKPLAGRIALVTGSGGGIGKAIARKFIEEGACVAVTDNHPDRLEATGKEFEASFGTDKFMTLHLDVTDVGSVRKAMQKVALAFGGLDIIVNNAGISISKPLSDHTEKDWSLLFDILVKGQFLNTQEGSRLMVQQGIGGDVINIVSKNALVSGPNNAGYGSAKAAQLHMSRLLAAELGPAKIRVNVVNPDAVISGSNIWNDGWAEGRARAYGVSVEELPGYYAKRTLLNEVILPEDIANACFAFVGGLLNKSTGNTINVDGGVAAAFLR
jgi:rhamnulose-1-phosphate aldolase/alcohol dehydrogenase